MRWLAIILCLLTFRASAFTLPFVTQGLSTVPPTITGIQLSGSSVQFAATGPYYVGTLTANLSPQTPTFNNVSGNAYSLVTSGGSCSGGDTTHFQIIGDGVYTNTLAANASPGYKLCITASATGATPLTATFTGITEGNKVDAQTFCAANGGGSGSSGSPWQAACIQAAANAAVAGDTVFLAAGNWALNTANSAVTITNAINLVGAGSGNTFNAAGNPSNASGVDLCPNTSPSTIAMTCVATTGANVTSGTVGTLGGYIRFSSCGYPSATGPVTLAHLFVDGSGTTAGGDTWGTVNFYGCYNNPLLLADDVRVLGFARNDLFLGGEAQFNIGTATGFNFTTKDSVIAAPLNPAFSPYYSAASPWFTTAGNPTIIQNTYMWEAPTPGINAENYTISGSTILMGADGSGHLYGSLGNQGLGVEGCAIGPGSGLCLNGQGSGHNGSYFQSFINDYLIGTGLQMPLGGGANDPGTAGAINALTYTGNTVTGSDPVLDSCVYHRYNPSTQAFGGCGPSVRATAASWNGANPGVVTFVAPNSSTLNVMCPGNGACNAVTFGTVLFTTAGYNTPQSVDQNSLPILWVPTTGNCTGGVSGSCTITAACGGAGQPPCPTSTPATSTLGLVAFTYGATGMQINGTNDSSCTFSAATPTAAYNMTNNSIIGTSTAGIDMAGNGMLDSCRLAPAQSNLLILHNNSVVGVNAQKNYFSSPTTNYYVSDVVNTVSPTVPGATNYCTGGGGTFTGTDSVTCQTTGFTSTPTVSFTLGLLEWQPALESAGTFDVPITSPSFTAQYGAVQWIGSTSPTTPGTGDSRWSHVPPAYIVGAHHGDTAYLWVMDSANHISAPVSAIIP